MDYPPGILPTDRPVVGILWRAALDSPLYRPWLEHCSEDVDVRVLADYEVAHELPAEIDLLVTHNHYRWDELAVLRQAMVHNNRGVLVLADGITEYRNSWQNPTTPAGSLMQPAVAHKIATLGAAQSRLWESWGNRGKCEVVGLPRLDQRARHFGWWQAEDDSLARTEVTFDATAAPTLLVCSARTPAFSESQWDVVLTQFACLHQCLTQSPPRVGERQVDIRWRVSDRISEHLQLTAEQRSTGDVNFAIDQATAVITTPSTMQLEAMLARRPVAILDFFNVPLYVPAAWHISAPSQIQTTVSEILEPSPERLFYQRTILQDQLWCQSSAIDRMGVLVRSMAQIARRQRIAERPIRFPDRILPITQPDHSLPVEWEVLTPQRQQWLDLARERQSSLWELTEVSAAILRAREYSEERRQLHYLTDIHHRAVQTYENALAEKSVFIEHLQQCLVEVQERLRVLNELLHKRNSEFDSLNQRLTQLSADKIEAHQQLTEAYADGKRKQERINELRTHYQQIREAHTKLKAKLDSLTPPPPANQS
jgi:hypothetical protein